MRPRKEEKWLVPFSPLLYKTRLSLKHIQFINKEVDSILSDKDKQKRLDSSETLAADISRQFRISPKILFAKNGPGDKILSLCEEYYSQYCLLEREFCVKPDGLSFSVKSSWVVDQTAGEFNPIHHHGNCQLSGITYLQVPPNMCEGKSWGVLTFNFGVPAPFSRNYHRIQPKVGDTYIFPSWLYHSVNPFRCEGNRRALSFNVTCSRMPLLLDNV
jgi:hypothetical protein